MKQKFNNLGINVTSLVAHGLNAHVKKTTEVVWFEVFNILEIDSGVQKAAVESNRLKGAKHQIAPCSHIQIYGKRLSVEKAF